MNLFSYLLILAALLCCTEAAYDVHFPDNISYYLDKNHKAYISGCRYNSRGRVYCEVRIPYVITKKHFEFYKVEGFDGKGCPPPIGQKEVIDGYENRTSSYRLSIIINIRNLTQKCKDSFKSTAHFKDVKLMSGNTVESLLADQTSNVKNGKLDASFRTYGNRKYTFVFTTKNNCVFYGDFNNIIANAI